MGLITKIIILYAIMVVNKHKFKMFRYYLYFVNLKVDHLDNIKVDLPWQERVGARHQCVSVPDSADVQGCEI